MMGDAIIFQLAATLDFMPAVVLTSKLCPKEVESTVCEWPLPALLPPAALESGAHPVVHTLSELAAALAS